jgi:type II restriction enzyme
MNENEILSIEEVLKTCLRNKFQNYNPEPASMPFHTRLLGKDRLALYAFIHSLNTNFGVTIFEPVAKSLAQKNFKNVKLQAKAGDKISNAAHKVIQEIMDNLAIAETSPDKTKEIEAIRKVCQRGKMHHVRLTQVDVWMENKSGELFLFDIKTAKPNAGGFKEFKRTLLEWCAAILAENPKAKVNTLIAIPYNPYEPKPYTRWTMRGMIDLEKELKVGKEFWDFIGGTGAYEDILGCFERVGIEMRDEIDAYFKKFKSSK